MINEKQLVISWDSYSWIHSMAGIIARKPGAFEVIIVTKDDKTPMHWTKELCGEAIYAQRADDLYRVGRTLGIPKMSNMLHDKTSLDGTQMIAELQMKIIFSGIQTVYFQDNQLLEYVLKAIKEKVNIEVYAFDRFEGHAERYDLNREERQNKRNLLNEMVALPHYQLEYDSAEYLYKI